MRPSFPSKRKRVPWKPIPNVAKRARMAAILKRRRADPPAHQCAAKPTR